MDNRHASTEKIKVKRRIIKGQVYTDKIEEIEGLIRNFQIQILLKEMKG